MDYDIVGFSALSVFLACAVEAVEALTIILAIGTVREWRSTLLGTGTAIIALALLVLIFGSSLENISRTTLWLVMGSLLLVFGAQWLRNAILRYTGHKSLHDESAIFTRVEKAARQEGTSKEQSAIDWYAFVIVFKGVFLEGLEVVFIVLSFGTSQANLHEGVRAAGLALLAVTILGLAIHRPLSLVPENTMKFIVGLLLTTFGTYFGSEGLGIIWPRTQLMFLYILIFYALVSGSAIFWLKRGKK